MIRGKEYLKKKCKPLYYLGEGIELIIFAFFIWATLKLFIFIIVSSIMTWVLIVKAFPQLANTISLALRWFQICFILFMIFGVYFLFKHFMKHENKQRSN